MSIEDIDKIIGEYESSLANNNDTNLKNRNLSSTQKEKTNFKNHDKSKITLPATKTSKIQESISSYMTTRSTTKIK